MKGGARLAQADGARLAQAGGARLAQAGGARLARCAAHFVPISPIAGRWRPSPNCSTWNTPRQWCAFGAL